MSQASTPVRPAAQEYRADIDGLRAVAVTAVIIGHAFGASLPGGFLGVDVFFVISGYVITLSLLGREHSSFGRFLGTFFLRRIKRLMPALLACFLVVCVVLLRIDPDPKTSLITGAWSLIGLSNVALYAQELDYFSASIRYNAFTHTWSLGVEEQFYLLFPVLFWLALARQTSCRAGALGIVVAVLSLTSVITFIALRESAPSLSYYMMPFRFWELGAGVLAAVWVHPGRQDVKGPRDWPVSVALAGLALVFVRADAGNVQGHVAAVMLTTVLLVYGAGRARASWMLTNPVSVYVGRISYSLYLWHWPMLAFGLLAPAQIIALPGVAIAAAFAAAVLSYHLVEQPVRRLRTPVPMVRHFALAFGAIFAAIGVIAFAHDLHKDHVAGHAVNAVPPAFLPLPGSGRDHNPTCVVDNQTRMLQPETFESCTFGPKLNETRTLWVLGDSHAGHLQGGLVALREEKGFGFHLVETPGVAFPITQDGGFASRDRLMKDVRAHWQAGDVVVLSRLFFERSETLELLADVPDWLERVDRFAAELASEDVDLLLVGPAPVFLFEDSRACDPADPASCSVPRAHLAPAMEDVYARLRNIAAGHENSAVLETFPVICPDALTACSPVSEGVFLYRDRDHLNVAGARALVPAMAAILNLMR